MRQIGINQYVGADPYVIDCYRAAKKEIEESRRAKAEDLKELKPIDRFFRIANDEIRRPAGYHPNFYTYYRVQENALCEIVRIQQQDFPDMKDCQEFIVQLKSIYVVDAFRSTGVATRTFEQIKDVCERTGCVLILWASAFGLSKDREYRNGFETFEDLWTAAFVEQYDVVYLHDWITEVAECFYQKVGLRNICLNSPNINPEEKEKTNWTNGHFAYIPDSLDPKYYERLVERLNPELSKFCSGEFAY